MNESRHLLVFGVPRINLHQEVKQLFAKYGSISKVKPVTEELKPNGSGKLLVKFWYLFKFGLNLDLFHTKKYIETDDRAILDGMSVFNS